MTSGIKYNSINPLVLIPSPRCIADFNQSIDGICEDKIWAKYMKEKDAYRLLQQFFIEHTEYTHAVIIPDDLIVSKQSFRNLRKRLLSTANDLPVLAGVCNLDYHNAERLSFCMNVSGFQFVTNEDLETGRIRGVFGPGSPRGRSHRSKLIKVGHEGFCCTFIRRDVMERIPLEGMNEEKDAHFDWAFSLNCYRNRIPIHVDTSARMLHLRNRLGEGIYENWGVGKYSSQFIYTKYNKHWNHRENIPKHIICPSNSKANEVSLYPT